MSKIQLSHRMYSIDDLKRLLDKGELIIQPKFQRRRTPWPNTAKTGLIDTIVYNYPIPPIYLRETISDHREKRKEIIDGQQRISTILEFITDKFELSKNFSDSDYVGDLFSELPFEIQQEIEDYELSFIAIRGADDSDVISIFSKINSFNLPLNKQEKRNALYVGQFKYLAYKLSSNYYVFWKDFKILSDRQISRMSDAEFVSEILTTIIVGFEKYRSKIDILYKKYEENFPESDYYYEAFNHIMGAIGNLFENKIIRSHFNRKVWFYTLFIILFEKIYGDIGTNQRYPLQNINLPELEDKLIEVIIDYNRDDFNANTKLLFIQGTGTSSNRQARHEFLLNKIS